MSDLPLPPEAVEAAAKAICESGRTIEQPTWAEVIDSSAYSPEHFLYLAQAAILAFLDAMGVTVEESEIGEQSGTILKEYRLSPSPWFPVKDNTSKEAVQ